MQANRFTSKATGAVGRDTKVTDIGYWQKHEHKFCFQILPIENFIGYRYSAEPAITGSHNTLHTILKFFYIA